MITGYDDENVYINDPLAVKIEAGKAISDSQTGTNFSIPIDAFKVAAGKSGWYGAAVTIK